MRRLALLPVLVALASFAMACGDGGSVTPADETFEALREEAEQTPVDNALREYASQLCSPFEQFFLSAGDLFGDFEVFADETESVAIADGTQEPESPGAEETASAAFEQALEGFGKLVDPYEELLEQMRAIRPPEELREFHESAIAEGEAAVRSFEAIRDEGFFEAFFLEPTPRPVEQPEGFEAAMFQECGDEIAGLVDEFGSDFVDSLFEDELD